MSFQTFLYKNVAIHGTTANIGESFLVTMSHGTRVFKTLEGAKKYIREQLHEIQDMTDDELLNELGVK